MQDRITTLLEGIETLQCKPYGEWNDEDHALAPALDELSLEILEADDSWDAPEQVHWLWDGLEDGFELKYCPEKWLQEVVALLKQYWRQPEAFRFRGTQECPGPPEDGPAANEASRLSMKALLLDTRQLDENRAAALVYAHILLRVHETSDECPERLERLGDINSHLLLVLGCWHQIKLPVYGLKQEERWDTEFNRHYFTDAELVAWIEEGQPKKVKCSYTIKGINTKKIIEEAEATRLAGLERVRPPYGELRDKIYKAILDQDEDNEMKYRSDMWINYHLREDKLNHELNKHMRREALGFQPKKSEQPRKRRGVSLKKVTGVDWQVRGFIPANDITLIWGARGSGKTRISLEFAWSCVHGTGLLDRPSKFDPVPVLFCASDSGAEPLKDELEGMGVLDDPAFQHPEDGGLFEVWAHSVEDQQESWGADLRGRIELFEWAKAHKGGVIFLDSAKTISTKAGLNYQDNMHVSELMTFLKEVIAPFCAVVVIAHDGTRSDRAGGAAAWEEVPSMVMSCTRPKGADGVEESKRRVFRAHKCRKADERDFYYEIDDETNRLKACIGTEVINDIRQIIRNSFLERLDAGQQHMTLQEITEMVNAQKKFSIVTDKTISNNLTEMTRGKTPVLKRVKNKRGVYQLNPYWLKQNR